MEKKRPDRGEPRTQSKIDDLFDMSKPEPADRKPYWRDYYQRVCKGDPDYMERHRENARNYYQRMCKIDPDFMERRREYVRRHRDKKKQSGGA